MSQCGFGGLQDPLGRIPSAWSSFLVCFLYLANSYAPFKTLIDTTFSVKPSWLPHAGGFCLLLIQQLLGARPCARALRRQSREVWGAGVRGSQPYRQQSQSIQIVTMETKAKHCPQQFSYVFLKTSHCEVLVSPSFLDEDGKVQVTRLAARS